MNTKLPLTVIVHTRNSAGTLARCLQSLPQATELLIVDMSSEDESVSIAKQFAAKIITVEDVGYVEPARSVALAAATQPWVLIVDADESLPVACHEWLAGLIEKAEHEIFALPRKNKIFGKVLEHSGWWPDYQVRLFKRGSVTWPAVIHAQPSCTSKPFQLPVNDDYAIIHDNYQNIAQFVDRMNRYTTIEVDLKPSGTKQAWISEMTGELFARLFAQKGWLDNEHGLAASLLQSYYPLVTRLKQWEKNDFSHNPEFSSQLADQLTQLQLNIAYWRATYQISQTRGFKQIYWRIRRKLQM